MKRLIKNMVVILVVLLASAAAQAELALVENFDGMSMGSSDGLACTGVMGGTLDTESEGTGSINIIDIDGSRVVTVIGLSTGVDPRAFGFNGITNTIDNSETGIAFCRFWLRSSSREPRTYIGLISDASDDPINKANSDNPMSIPAGFSWVDNGSGGLDIVTTDGATVLKAGLARSQWYNVWIVANNEADTFDLYLSKAEGPAGEATLPTPGDLVESNIPFGVATTEPLTGMIFTCQSGTGQADRIYIDEIYWDGDQGLGTPTKARNPIPANEKSDVPRDVVFSWTPGPFAATHNLYFGTSFDDVSGGIGGVTQSLTSYTPAQRLDFATTYYWRVDEVNAPPDNTVHRGGVWSFTTEPVAYPIAGENITATASSQVPDQGPENTVNGSGLVDQLHSTELSDMWLTSDSDTGPAWIQFDFEKAYKLHEMLLWNYNREGLNTIYGFRDVIIEHSTDGTSWTPLSDVPEFPKAPGTDDYRPSIVNIGNVIARYVKITVNSNWIDNMFNQHGLSEVRFMAIPVSAREPSPDSGATDVSIGTIDETIDVTLGFRAGRDAARHDVYLSSDEQAVIDGNAPVAVTETSYGPLSLDLGTTYYWRVDEVNEAETTTTWQGDLWDFRTQEYFVVEDFEDYNDWEPDEIWRTWEDGYEDPVNGSTAGYPDPIDYFAGEHYVETTIVHGGKQAMPFFYDNIGAAAYSEAERTFALPQDWTKAGIQTLVLHFLGDPNNVVEQMYARLNGSKVVYNGDAADITQAWWHQWNIDLASFGVEILQNVTKLAIGIEGSGASGILYFDNFRLYRSVPGPPAGIWIEAEAADGITSPMEIYDDLKASGGKYISTDESVGNSSDAPPAPAGTASYTFTVAGGTYKITCRINIPSGSNAFWVRIQGAAIPIETELHSSGWVKWNGMPNTGNWYWHDVFSDDDNENATVLFTLPAGTHTLDIAYRDDGTMLDAIVISKID